MTKQVRYSGRQYNLFTSVSHCSDCHLALTQCTVLAGLDVALDLLKDIGDRNNLSYADLFQLASAVAIEVSQHRR